MTAVSTEQRIARLAAAAMPTDIPTNQEAVAQWKSTEALKPGFLDAVGEAINSEWAGAWAFRQLAASGYEPDPEFPGVFSSVEYSSQFTDGLDLSMWDMLDNAVSQPHAMKLRQQALSVQESRRRLSTLGWKGAAIQIGAGMLDPAFIALGVATGGLGEFAYAGTQATRLSRGVRTGLIAAASEVPLTAYVATQDPQTGVGDVLLSGIGAFAIGGGIGAIVGNSGIQRAVDSAVRETEFSDVARGAMGAAGALEMTPEMRAVIARDILTENGRVRFKPDLDPEILSQRVVQMIEHSNLDPDRDADLIRELVGLDPDAVLRRFVDDDAVDNPYVATPPREPTLRPPTTDEIEARAGQLLVDMPNMDPAAARQAAMRQIQAEDAAKGAEPTAETPPPVEPPRPPKTGTDFNPMNVQPSEADLRNWRIGMIGRLDPRAVVTNLSAILFAQDSLLRKAAGKFVPAIDSASEWGLRTQRRVMADYYRVYLRERKSWLRENGITFLNERNGIRDFNHAVAVAITDESAFAQASKQVKAAVIHQRKHQADILRMMQRHGVKGALRVAENDNYLTRIWLPNSIRATIGKLGKDGESLVHDFFKRAILAGQPDLDEAIAARMGRGMVRTILDMDSYTDIEKARLFSADSSDMIAAVLKREMPEITEEQIAEIVYKLVDPKKEANVPSRLKRRTLLDENYEEQVVTEAGNFRLRMEDLVNRDAEALFQLYTRQAIGASGEATVYENMSKFLDPTGALKIENFDQLARRASEQMSAAGMTNAQIKSNMDSLETLWRSVKGLRQRGDLDPDGAVSTTLRVLRGLNYLIRGGSFGIAQIPELGTMIGKAGARTMLKHVPTMGEMFKRAADGKLENELLSQIEGIWGIGTDHFIHQITDRMEGLAAPIPQGGSTGIAGAVARAEAPIQRLNQLQGKIGLMTGIDTFSRRLSAVAAIQYIADLAAKGRVSTKRLLEMGLTEPQAQRIFSIINDPKNVETVNGAFGKRVKRINFDNWGDEQAASQFITAVDKLANEWVQTNNVGATFRWMNKDLGKSIFQFRSFVINGWERQTLKSVQMRDYQAFTSAMAATFLGSMVYMGQTYVNSLGRKDGEKFRKERLTADKILAIGWARSGSASLAPAFIDNAWSFTGGDPIFQIGRYSGLDSTGFFQNPTTALANSILRTGPAIGNEVREAFGGETSRFTQADARAFTALVPFSNLFGIKNVLDWFVTSRPKQ